MDALLKLLANADQPFDDEAVSMDCNDGCEEIAQLAERVAQGEKLDVILPSFATHLDQIECCREEFEVLVSVIQAEEAIAREADAAAAESTNDASENQDESTTG